MKGDPTTFSGGERQGLVALDDAQRTQLTRALVYIEENLSNPIEVNHIARIACYTPRHFQRLFQAFTGETVRNHLRRLRAERAVVLIRYLDLNVTQAALSVGFSNTSGLYKAVREHFGCAPEDVRDFGESSPAIPEPFAIRAVEVPSIQVAFLRHIGDPKGSLKVWMKLLAWARGQGLLSSDAQLIGINHDSTETEVSALRYDAAIQVPNGFRPTSESGLAVRELPGGLVLQHSFHGTVDALEQRWNILTEKWFPRSGWKLRDPICYDIYPGAEASWQKLAALLMSRFTKIRATLCIPILPRRLGTETYRDY